MHLARAAVRGSLRPLVLQQQQRQCRPTIIQQHFSALVSSQQWDSHDDDTQFMARHPNPDHHADIYSNRSRSLNNHFQHAQVRFRRHDRASAFSKPRPHTKKQRSEYNRKLKKWQDEKDKHSAPGSQAGPHRQWMRERRQELLDKGTENEVIDPSWLQQYGYGDALLDDLVGNTSHLTSQPTPEPVHLGHAHKRFYNKVADQMERYRESIDALRSTTISEKTSNNNNEILDPTTSTLAKLPSGTAIANVLRAYRDQHGTRNKPIGIAMALQHLLQDLKVPTAAFGEHTYTTLLTCCRTPNEARRIFKLMNDNQHPISSYSWSILVDVHSKVADFEGCGKVIQEMVSEGIPPTQAAYTSLLAACYKVCSDGRIAHSVRSKAGEFGWKQWQEMRIIGIDPDAMAYGAMIRLCAARGRPERAMNLLQEMQRFHVKPTTLCFSSALRAVAKSHEIAIRFERGSSRKQLRRESFAAHHGQMARQIVILAENAEVEMDEGFTSALMLCAAASGDSATAKAVYLASEVRKMDHLRTVGPESHLKRLRGVPESETEESETARIGLGSDSKLALAADSSNGETAVALANNSSVPAPYSQETNLEPTYGEREYGKDTRALSALLRACANAVSSNGIGTIWAGNQNQGYLCENSLRLITTRWEPTYTDNSIPGVDYTKLGISALRKSPQDERERIQKPGSRVKFQGLFMDEDVAMTVDDLDGDYTKIVEDGSNSRGITQGEDDVDDFIDVAGRRARSESFNMNGDAVEESVAFTSVSDLDLLGSDDDTLESTPQSVETKPDKQEEEDELYFDKDARRWKSRPKVAESKQATDELATDYETQRLNELRSGGAKTEQSLTFEDADDAGSFSDGPAYDEEEVFQTFYSELKEEATRNGETDELDEEDAREFFEMMQEELTGALVEGESDDDLEVLPGGEKDPLLFDDDENAQNSATEDNAKDLDGPDQQFEDEWREEGMEGEIDVDETSTDLFDGTTILMPAMDTLSVSDGDVADLEEIKELQQALPGLPASRLKKIRTAFKSTLGYPSFLTLVPLLRENMPDHVSAGWLKKMNTTNADFVLERARADGVMDVHLLNAGLEVKTNAANLDQALAFYEDQYKQHKMKPTGYSDRLVLQMLVDNNRLPRALAFKEKLEGRGRALDIPSYGSLVEYYGRRDQLGSALMVLKECIDRHDAPPSEKYLTKVRVLCRQQGLEEAVHLKELIGDDPIEWLRHGERYLKRERTKKGRRNVLMAYNSALN